MKKFFEVILLACSLCFLEAQEQTVQEELFQEQVDENLIISKINFIGLKKTRESYIQSKVKKFLNEPGSEENLHNLETTLQLEGLFNDIKIESEKKNDTECELNISVTEKITFIPLPFAMYSDTGFMAGGVIMDTNAFGRKDMFMFGGFFSKETLSGMAAFSKSAGEHGRPGISVFVSTAKKFPEYDNLSEEVVLKFKSIAFDANLLISEKFSEHITFSNGFSFSSSSNRDVSDYEGFSPESIITGSVSFSLGYSKSDWNGVFMSTNSASISAEAGLTNSDEKKIRYPRRFSFSIGEQYPIFWDRFRIYQKISGFYGIDNHLSAFTEQGAGSVSILPGYFVTERIIGGNAGFELALKKFSWGMISIYADYQLVYAQDFTIEGDGDYEFEHGANGGMRLYLAKIAFPALGIGLSYNVMHNRWQFSAAMGVSF
ncbi:MAG: hypothetical protein IJ630_08325 [Treponema sp.]|nr:hypothetical protein [Treponema sp.]